MAFPKVTFTRCLVFVSVLLFLVLFPLVNKINFYQNDDWVYYQQISNFKQLDFRLLPIIAPTFYLQGFLGLLFTFVFKIEKLPLLTLLVSIGNFVVFSLILRNNLKKSSIESILYGLIFFLNPLHIYSILGFMTENYFIFFLLLAFYFSPRKLFLSNLFGIMAFFVKQVGLCFSAALCVYFLLNKKYKEALYQLLLAVSAFLFYLYIFPRTSEMVEKPTLFTNYFHTSLITSLIVGMSVVLVGFTLPIICNLVYDQIVRNKSVVKMLLLIITSITFYFYVKAVFEPQRTNIGEFPYFGNTLERMGFFYLGGTKYNFMGSYDLYNYWNSLSFVALALIVPVLIIYLRKSTINPYIVFILVYTAVILMSERLYDRYILVLVPVFILFIADYLKKMTAFWKIAYLLFVVFLAFYAYQFSYDFVLGNKYMWDKSREIVEKEGISPKLIEGPNAWKLSNVNLQHNYTYVFSYDDPGVNSELDARFLLVDTYVIAYPLNFFVNPKIYLYKIKD